MQLFAKFFNDLRAYQGDSHSYVKHVWCDNSSSHNASPMLDATLARKNTRLYYLSPCTTHLVQPANQFIITKIKEAWV